MIVTNRHLRPIDPRPYTGPRRELDGGERDREWCEGCRSSPCRCDADVDAERDAEMMEVSDGE